MKYEILSTAIILTFMSSSVLARPLCNSNETVIFSCELTNAKTVSICSNDLNNKTKTGYIEYRYGTAQEVELTLPKNRSYPTKSNVHRTTLGNSDTLSHSVAFKSGSYSYNIYQYAPKRTSGIKVRQKGKDIVSHTCSSYATFKDIPTMVKHLYLDK